MKAFNKIKAGISGLIIMCMVSCGDGYLEVDPNRYTGPETVFSNLENAATAINGLSRLMSYKYMSQGFNGEGTIKLYYGDYPGETLGVNLSGWSDVINSNDHERVTSTYTYYPWLYYYTIISNANLFLENIDRVPGKQSVKDFYTAQALTFRAYSYMMLAQLYCYRWSDSNEGSADGLVLRLDTSQGPLGLSSLKETYLRIYTDLDDAIRLFSGTDETRGTSNFLPDINVAYAVYARAALNKQDYRLAADQAAKAREGYPLMSVDNYKKGFNTPNDEWIWSCYGSKDEELQFYSFFAYIGYNANAGAVRSTPKYISRELYNKIPESDIRKNLFLDPEDYPYTTSTGLASASSGPELRRLAYNRYPILEENGSNVFAYMNFKFYAAEQVGVGHLSVFRSSEMYLIEAEAEYILGNEKRSRELMEELTLKSGRDGYYSCTASGEELFEEIKLYRSIELWGEGFNWFDLKRWGDTLVRRAYKNGGNFLTALSVTIKPEEKNKWTWKIPAKETDYNSALD